jgi:hypothetical protein
VWIYNPNIKKLDPRTTSGHFINYAVNFKGFRFYCPSNNTRIVESMNAKFLEDLEHSGGAYPQRIELEEAQELTDAPLSKGSLIMFKEIQTDCVEPQSISEQLTHEEQVHNEQVQNEPTQTPPNEEKVGLRRSSRIIRPTLSSNYIVYLKESDFDVGPVVQILILASARIVCNIVYVQVRDRIHRELRCKN